MSEPVYECVTRQEEICHAGYLTEYTRAAETRCSEVYEKKCNIHMMEVTVNETVRTCSTPLQRVCRVRRDTLQSRIRPLGAVIAETVLMMDRAPLARSLEDEHVSQRVAETLVDESECRTYLETVCVREDQCEELPVRVCADKEGCVIQEIEENCKVSVKEVTRLAPRELCAIIPRNLCKRVTKLVPRLIEKEYCRSVPKKTCRLNFNKTMDSPNLVPIVQKYCIVQGNISETEGENTKFGSETENVIN